MRAHGMRVAVLAGLWLFVTTAVFAQSVKDVEIRGVGDGTRIVLDVDGAVSHKSFILTNPDRVVLDLIGASNSVKIDKRNANRGTSESYPMGFRALQLPDSNIASSVASIVTTDRPAAAVIVSNVPASSRLNASRVGVSNTVSPTLLSRTTSSDAGSTGGNAASLPA